MQTINEAPDQIDSEIVETIEKTGEQLGQVRDAIGLPSEESTTPEQLLLQAVADEAMASEDYKEGGAAFAAKRDPVFKGK